MYGIVILWHLSYAIHNNNTLTHTQTNIYWQSGYGHKTLIINACLFIIIFLFLDKQNYSHIYKMRHFSSFYLYKLCFS